jgi:hypothetical protein
MVFEWTYLTNGVVIPAFGADLAGFDLRHRRELGKADLENLRSGPPDLPEMFRNDESHQCDRGSGRHQKDTQTTGIMGG